MQFGSPAKWVTGAVALLATAVLVIWLLPSHQPNRWIGALSLAPADTARESWTDWAAIRASLKNPPAATLPLRAYDADLTTTSAMTDSAADLAQIGLSYSTIDWELLVQAPTGQADLLHLTHAVDPSTWNGWTRSGDLWIAPDSISTTVLHAIAWDAGRGILIASDSASFLKHVLDGLGSGNGVPDAVRAADGAGAPLSAYVLTGSYACSALAMAHAGGVDQAAGQDLIARAGQVNPLTSYVLTRQSARTVTIAMGFADHDQAIANANSRSELAAGEAPGIGGRFTDLFKLGQVTASGSVVTMNLVPKNQEPLMGELATGPILFATC